MTIVSLLKAIRLLMKSEVLFSMINDGALVVQRESNGSRYSINYKIVQEKYPECMEELIIGNLNDYERMAYELGYFDYQVTDDGKLAWYFIRDE